VDCFAGMSTSLICFKHISLQIGRCSGITRETSASCLGHNAWVIVVLQRSGAMSPVPAFLAIVPPKAEVNWLADSIAAREGPIHVAALIALVALFIIAWMLLTESPTEEPGVKAAK